MYAALFFPLGFNEATYKSEERYFFSFVFFFLPVLCLYATRWVMTDPVMGREMHV